MVDAQGLVSGFLSRGSVLYCFFLSWMVLSSGCFEGFGRLGLGLAFEAFHGKALKPLGLPYGLETAGLDSGEGRSLACQQAPFAVWCVSYITFPMERLEIPSRSLRSSGVLPYCQGYHQGVGHASACSHN